MPLVNELWLALKRQEFCQFDQPKFKAPSGPVIGFEALLRWQHPQQDILTLDLFLPLADKTGLIILLGNWVVNEAGIEASIDDFSTGHSSLLYLKRLPASELKIDRAFIRQRGIGDCL